MTKATDAFARLLCEDEYLMEVDEIALVDAMQASGLLDEAEIVDLCQALELCEVHHCDHRICADDQDLTCPTGREASEREGR